MTIVVLGEDTIPLTKREWDRLIFEFKDRPANHDSFEPWLRAHSHILRRLRGQGGSHMSKDELEWPAQITPPRLRPVHNGRDVG